MGEYFKWVNVDKKECLGLGVFSGSFDRIAPCWVCNRDTDAVCTLLTDRWRGDTVVFLGDETTSYWPDNSPEALEYRENESTVYLDYADDFFDDISGIFKEAEGLTYNVYGELFPKKLPYTGPFEHDIQHFRFVINYSRKLYYDRTRTPVRCLGHQSLVPGALIVRFDPFPMLLQQKNSLDSINDHICHYFEESWVGDNIGFSNEDAPSDFLDISHVYSFWGPGLAADDATLLEAMESAVFRARVEAGEDAMVVMAEMLPECELKYPLTEPKIGQRFGCC